MSNIPIRLIAILPMLLLAAALIATACESATPDAASQSNAIAAAAPTITPTPTATPTPMPTTPTGTAAALNCQAGSWYETEAADAIRACAKLPNPLQCPADRLPPPPIWNNGIIDIFQCLPPPTPTPKYQKLQDGLSYIAEASEARATIRGAAGSSQEESLDVVIEIDREPRDLVKWLVANGAIPFGSHYTSLVDDEWVNREEAGSIDNHYGIIFLSDYVKGKANLEPLYEGGVTLVGAYVPSSLLARLSQQPGVIVVRKDRLIRPRSEEDVQIPIEEEAQDQRMLQSQQVPHAPQPPSRVTPTPTPKSVSWGVVGNGVDSWHKAGYKGSGVKIGIIDTGFLGFPVWQGSDLPSSVNARCYDGTGSRPKTRLSDCADKSRHGVYVSEAIYDIAPDATYYIAQIRSRFDLERTVNWMILQGVDVINQSLSWRWDGTGNGRTTVADSPLKVVDRAVSKGVLWVNSAGNEARQTWYGNFNPNSLKYHKFQGSDICNEIIWRLTGNKVIQLRWEGANNASANPKMKLLLKSKAVGATPVPANQSSHNGNEVFEYDITRAGAYCIYV